MVKFQKTAVRSLSCALLFCASITTSAAEENKYTTAEIAKHKTVSSCWLVIEAEVYDVTKYLKRHTKFDYDIARHCGSDVSKEWRKKPRTGERHSRKAERLLERYRIGELVK